MRRKVFPLNAVLRISPLLLEKVNMGELLEAAARHDHDDWGEVSKKTKLLNQRNMLRGGPLISEYISSNGVRFRAKTDSKSAFTVLSANDR